MLPVMIDKYVEDYHKKGECARWNL
jgi:hypothetical protein